MSQKMSLMETGQLAERKWRHTLTHIERIYRFSGQSEKDEKEKCREEAEENWEEKNGGTVPWRSLGLLGFELSSKRT